MIRFKAYLQTYKKEIIFLLFIAFVAVVIERVHFYNEKSKKARDKAFFQEIETSETSEDTYSHESIKATYSSQYSVLGQLVVGVVDSYFDCTANADKSTEDIYYLLKYSFSNMKPGTQIDIDINSACLDIYCCFIDISDSEYSGDETLDSLLAYRNQLAEIIGVEKRK